MTLKASPLSNRGVRLGVPPVLNTRESHPEGVPEGQDMQGDGALLQSAFIWMHQPWVLALLAPAVTERRRLQRL